MAQNGGDNNLIKLNKAWKDEAVVASLGGAHEDLHLCSKATRGSFLAFFNKVRHMLGATRMEEAMYRERFLRKEDRTSVNFKDFDNFRKIIEQMKQKMHRPSKVLESWMVQAGTIVTPLKFSMDKPSFFEFIISIVDVEMESSEVTKTLAGTWKLFNKDEKGELFWKDYLDFFSTREWMAQAHAEVQWWFPHGGLLDHRGEVKKWRNRLPDDCTDCSPGD